MLTKKEADKLIGLSGEARGMNIKIDLDYIFEKYGLKYSLNVVSKIHGQEFVGKASYGNVTVVALYHPAAALYNGSMKKKLIFDFKILKYRSDFEIVIESYNYKINQAVEKLTKQIKDINMEFYLTNISISILVSYMITNLYLDLNK